MLAYFETSLAEAIEKFSRIDLGRSILSVVIIISFILVLSTILRSIEIPIRILLDKRREDKSLNDGHGKDDKELKGF